MFVIYFMEDLPTCNVDAALVFRHEIKVHGLLMTSGGVFVSPCC